MQFSAVKLTFSRYFHDQKKRLWLGLYPRPHLGELVDCSLRPIWGWGGGSLPYSQELPNPAGIPTLLSPITTVITAVTTVTLYYNRTHLHVTLYSISSHVWKLYDQKWRLKSTQQTIIIFSRKRDCVKQHVVPVHTTGNNWITYELRNNHW